MGYTWICIDKQIQNVMPDVVVKKKYNTQITVLNKIVYLPNWREQVMICINTKHIL